MRLVKQHIADGKVLGLIEKFLKMGVMEEAGLQLHPEKTRVVNMAEPDAYFDFLGYRFKRGKTGKLLKVVRPKSLQKLRGKLKKPTKRSNGKSMEAIIAEINPVLRAWYEYFKHAIPNTHSSMDGWVRMRLRSVLRKRQGKKGRGRGIDHHKWPNRYFEKLGLFSLEQALEETLSLRRGGKC